MNDDGRVDDPSHAVGIKLSVKIDKTNIYLPIQIFISVTGRLEIDRRHNLVSIKYYYEKINYGDTLIEIYKKPVVKYSKKVKKRV